MNKTTLLIAAAVMAYASNGWAQSLPNLELEMACQQDIDLNDYVINAIDSGQFPPSEMVSENEVNQIKAALNDDNIAGLSSDEKLLALSELCAQGQIFQQRFQYIAEPDAVQPPSELDEAAPEDFLPPEILDETVSDEGLPEAQVPDTEDDSLQELVPE